MLRRGFVLAGCVAVMLAGCDASTTTPATSGTEQGSPSPSPSLPAGVPPWLEDDVPAGDVPAAALIPLRATVTGTWFGSTQAGEAMVVAWQAPGDDPFRLARGVAAWRRFDDGGAPWRPVWGATFRPSERVLGIEGTTGDVTGDGSDEIVLFTATGGTGSCGSYAVVELGTGDVIFELPDVCDTRLEADLAVPGLVRTEAVFEPGDAHCCPSALETTTLTYDGDGGWTASVVTRTNL